MHVRIVALAAGLSAAVALLFAQGGVVSAGKGSAYTKAAQLPARIMSFTVEPASVEAGQAATLVWSAENPLATAIEPGVGTVRPRGSLRVTPSATTTYTLTVRGPNNTSETRTVTLNVSGGSGKSGPSAAAAKSRPDLSGVYNSSSFNFGGAQARGQNQPIAAVLKPGAEKFKVVRGPEDTGLYSNCMPTGVPGAYFVPYQWEIVQGVDRIVILYEYPHLFRVIPTRGGPHQKDLDPTWMGDSIGHWEDDALVVDTIGFNDKTELPGGYKHTEDLHVVERFRRPDAENLEYEATIEDPNVFEKPWKISRTFPLRRDLERVDEFVCENNRDYTPLFKK